MLINFVDATNDANHYTPSGHFRPSAITSYVPLIRTAADSFVNHISSINP